MTTPTHDPTPSGVPLLARGKHRDPADGSCLMEYVSVLSGRRFGDRPRCTHPLLGWLARRVNDQVGDAVRARLTGVAPALVGTRVHGPHARGVVRAVVYGELATLGLVGAPRDPWLRDLHDRADEHLGHRVSGRRSLGATDRNRAFEAACESVGDLDREDRDRLLAVALARSVTRARRHLRLPAVGVVLIDAERSVAVLH
ncbi:hypothetical protein Acsp06_43490 [Actinomycetospora sp. NBRC 106375]|uniref:hypothetical protein n=1 Tax=Actinomycetospora sp. NBRC 106375 TaxID=3032207 RepID=UPI0024A03FCF|nr:hypothetical protein [Actinomycetospora sp. NBRC 106375]GLZ48164.1 hypothetical protein Acsp06_43490 [Actinomycetospora sp. NBRC 106375]